MTLVQHPHSNPRMEHVRCSLCGADDTTELIPSTLETHPQGDWRVYACTSSGYGRHAPIVECKQCGFVYQNPRPTTDSVLGIYTAVKDPLYVEEREGRILTFQHHLKPMETYSGPAQGRRLLDVGAYTGVFVEIAQKNGWDAWGIEPSTWAVGQARDQGLNMIHGTLDEDSALVGEQPFSVVTMWDVIEHVVDPLASVKAAWQVLEPGGLLVLHTMDLGSLFAKIMGKRWPWFMEMHLVYFTRKTMRLMLEQAGFEVAWMGAQGRFLHAGYLANRLAAWLPFPGKIIEKLINGLGMRNLSLRVDMGDLFTTYAYKLE